MLFSLYRQAQNLGDPIVKIPFVANTATHAGALACRFRLYKLYIGATASVSTGETLTYLWTPAADLSSAKVLNPTVTPTAGRVYTLTVT